LSLFALFYKKGVFVLRVVFLDFKTVGDVDISKFRKISKIKVFNTTKGKKQTIKRVKNADIIITNKVVIDKDILKKAHNLKLICVAATGMNNIDLLSAKKLKIEVKNVKGYSTSSVVDTTFAHYFNLMFKINQYNDYAKPNGLIAIFLHILKILMS
jgi:glycerate dehydrogenase